MSDNYTICCIIEGEDSPFIVEIGSNAIVGHLKKAIKKEQFHTLSNIEDKHIKVYQVDLPEKPNIKEGVSKKMLENPTPLMLTTEMGEAYPSGPPKKTIHIVVRVPSKKRKRSLSDLGDQDIKRINDLVQIPSISPTSIQQKDVTNQLNGKVIYNRPVPSRETIPIVLLHNVFARFLDDCRNHAPTKEDNRWLRELRYAMLKEYDDEATRCEIFRENFLAHTSKELATAVNPEETSYSTDGHLSRGYNFLLVTKGNEPRDMSADPQLQSFAHYLNIVKKCAIRARDTGERSLVGKMPCLIVYYFGSMIGFAGAVASPKPQFEPLTHLFDLQSNEHDHEALLPLIRALGALRNAINSLEEEYIKLSEPSARLANPFYPFRSYFTSRDNSKVEFEYQERLHRHKLLFRVSTSEQNRNLLLKFTQKYSKGAHEHCASHKIAPELYAIEEMAGGWMMVVMEYLNEETYTLLCNSRIPEQILRTGVRNAVFFLHRGNFVHGDIRGVNIMVKREWNECDVTGNVKLIDFDWAGQEGSARYPPNVNYEQVERPREARDGLFITKDHDDFMTNHLFPSR